MATIQNLLDYIDGNPEICGLEAVLIDNVHDRTPNIMRRYAKSEMVGLTFAYDLLISPKTPTDVCVYTLVTALKREVVEMELSFDAVLYVDDIVYESTEQLASWKFVDGKLYLRYVELNAQ
jgi:hypothetical protein